MIRLKSSALDAYTVTGFDIDRFKVQRQKTPVQYGGMELFMKSSCDFCMNYIYDEEFDAYACSIDMDEDEIYGLFSDKRRDCPYFRMGDDYTIVRKQN